MPGTPGSRAKKKFTVAEEANLGKYGLKNTVNAFQAHVLGW